MLNNILSGLHVSAKELRQKKISILFKDLLPYVGWGGVVSTATFYGLDGQGIEFWLEKILCTQPDQPWGPPRLPHNGYQSFLGVKELECGVNQPPHLAPRLKEQYSNTSTPSLGSDGRYRLNFTLPITIYHFITQN
jgi:hypothetical protein